MPQKLDTIWGIFYWKNELKFIFSKTKVTACNNIMCHDTRETQDYQTLGRTHYWFG
jgi:hypothetical protein